MLKKLLILCLSCVLAISLTGCHNKTSETQGGDNAGENTPTLQVVATSTMLRDLAEQIGKEKATVTGIMAPGVDPHLYKPTAGDIEKIEGAQMVVYNGLHFEGQMVDVLEGLNGKVVVNASAGLPKEDVLPFADDPIGDPHIWNSSKNWESAAEQVAKGYIDLDPENKEFYEQNLEAYKKELAELKTYIDERVAEIPEESRVLVTAHDAFSYFARDYGFEVKGIQGISTESEASTKDISDLAEFIVSRHIKAIFSESSVPQKNIDALKEAVEAKGQSIVIGGQLFSDSLGDEGTPEGTYIGMMKYNIDTVVNALK